MKKKNAVATAGIGNPGVLYVVLHGLISLVDANGSNSITAFALEMQDHRYLVGTWLTEEEIPARPPYTTPLNFTLAGVDTGADTLRSHTNQNVVLQLATSPDLNHPGVRVIFNLPRPSKVHHFNTGNLPAGGLSGADVGSVVGNPGSLSSIRIFEYTFKDHNQVQLGTVGNKPVWTCPGTATVPTPVGNIEIAVLHIYNLPGEDLLDLPGHTLDEFHQSAAFLGKDLSLTNPIPTVGNGIVPPGLLPAETVCLAQRDDEVLEILDGLRTGNGSSGTGGCAGGGVCAASSGIL